jgi:hypothetical protein
MKNVQFEDFECDFCRLSRLEWSQIAICLKTKQPLAGPAKQGFALLVTGSSTNLSTLHRDNFNDLG